MAIALGLLKGAQVFLLDEPTSGLDPQSSADFSEVVRRLKIEGKAILLSTHDIFGVANLADRVAVLENGRIVQEGAPGDIGRFFGSRRGG